MMRQILVVAFLWSTVTLGFVTRNFSARLVVPINELQLKAHKSDQGPPSSSSSSTSLRKEAENLLLEAQKLRSEIGQEDGTKDSAKIASGEIKPPSSTKSTSADSPWRVQKGDEDNEGDGYRLYIDIGREEGTWMDRRWGASGRRISFTLDIFFSRELFDGSPRSADSDGESKENKLVKDNFGGKSSLPYVLRSANSARLRDGFEKMKCSNGCYRIDTASGRDTVRFYVEVEGTKDDQGYGDIFIPQGCLYFSLPCFGGSTSQLSIKEGPVTVRQMGWNTGWRREESRIVGTFYAKPIDEAMNRDSF